jgi:hypothetical protein
MHLRALSTPVSFEVLPARCSREVVPARPHAKKPNPELDGLSGTPNAKAGSAPAGGVRFIPARQLRCQTSEPIHFAVSCSLGSNRPQVAKVELGTALSGLWQNPMVFLPSWWNTVRFSAVGRNLRAFWGS